MKSFATPAFWACFAKLPNHVQDTARRGFEFWKTDPAHPGLRFKPIQGRSNLWSVRVGSDWRALGLVDGDTIHWFWIGSHADYDRKIGR
jgi:hypothetical protein